MSDLRMRYSVIKLDKPIDDFTHLATGEMHRDGKKPVEVLRVLAVGYEAAEKEIYNYRAEFGQQFGRPPDETRVKRPETRL